MANLKPIIEQSMTQYAGAVLQSRALVDARDCLKPSARQIFYCMDKYKYTAAKPFQKTMAAIGDAMKHFYIHGDSSCEGIIMRAGQSFAMRYPLVEVKGNGGTLLASGNWAAPRYTEARLSKLAAYLFDDIDKETIEDWRDNYADNEQYPSVLPTKGFYNIVNGSQGIGIGMACSIPQYNLKELNNALIHLIDNPDCSFEEIYCAPDFATGAILYNEEDVKNSMRDGYGYACKLRSVVEFDAKERCFVVTEIPYGVYTDTISGQLEEIVNGEDNPGIERFNDLTGARPLIKIYLGKKANPDKVLKYLYKNTSLQYHYGINFTMLDQGRFPKVFT
jgi:DNA gyrase subunit A